jgi:hypothetical protein
LNGLTAQVQNLAVGTSGTDFAISSVTSTHTFNLPTASGTNRGALSSADWTTFNDKVASNTAITGATKTKITYDAKGLVTAGADATTADIADSSNKRYQTDAQKTDFTNPKITVECINALTVDFYAMYTFQIDSVTAITNSPTTTILVNNSAYTFGVSIATGAKITVTLNTAGVVNLNTTRL